MKTRMHVKRMIKRLLSRQLYSSEIKIIKAIDNAEIISFDIFDTLVKRDVQSPEHIYEIVSCKYYKKHAIMLDDYPQKRIQAEIRARKNSKNEEVTLKEIFDCLDIYSPIMREELYGLEVETEFKMCCPNHRMFKLYHYALRQGKHIVITSDMYLPEAVIIQILEKCGLNEYKKLYLSSSYGKTKRTGHIFDNMMSDYSELRGKILHIGDNLLGDYIVPLRKGIKCCLIDGGKNNLHYWKRPSAGSGLSDSCWLYAFLNNRISALDDQSEAAVIGYEVLGPLLLGFCQWLHKRTREDKVEKLFFLSREGKLLQEAYNVMHSKESLPQCYLHVSRRALLVPLVLETENYDELIDLMKVFLLAPQLKTVGEILFLDKEEYARGLNSLGLDIKTLVYEVDERKKPAVFKLVCELGKDRFIQQNDLLSRYLEQNEFSGKVGIVDIGWNGTMQRYLSAVSRDKDVEIHGYYMGIRNLEKKSFYLKMHRLGYLFSPGRNIDIDQEIRFTTGLFETLFLDIEGSLMKYRKGDNGRIIPVHDEIEYGKKEKEFIETTHHAALHFLNEIMCCGYMDRDKQFEPSDVFTSYVSFGVRPSMQTVDLFRDFVFVNGTIRNTIVPIHSLFYYVWHPRELAKGLETSCNRVFFLKKILKLNIPYAKILRLLADKGVTSQYRKRFVNEQGK